MERQLENSLSEYEIVTVTFSRDRRSDVARDVICDVTLPHFNFWVPVWKQKPAFVLGRIRKIPGSCHEVVRVTKILRVRATARSAIRSIGLVARDFRGAPPGKWLAPSFQNRSPLVYFVGGIRGQWTTKSSCSNEGELRVSIITTIGGLSWES